MKYKIEVRSLGYEDHTKVVDVSSLREAKRFEREAKVEWMDKNALNPDAEWEMPFTRVSKL